MIVFELSFDQHWNDACSIICTETNAQKPFSKTNFHRTREEWWKWANVIAWNCLFISFYFSIFWDLRGVRYWSRIEWLRGLVASVKQKRRQTWIRIPSGGTSWRRGRLTQRRGTTSSRAWSSSRMTTTLTCRRRRRKTETPFKFFSPSIWGTSSRWRRT